MSTQITVAAVQAEPAWMDLEGTVAKTIDFIEKAAKDGVQLIAFPETWIPCYPVFLWTVPVPEQMPYVARFHENSLSVDSPQMTRIREAARDNKIMVVMGFSEKAFGTLYMAQVIIGTDGRVLLHRRKLKPTHVERTLFGEGDGSDIKVIETEFGRVGALNCWEHFQPLTKYAMYAQNEQIHVSGWPCFGVLDMVPALSHDTNVFGASKVYALEGSTFVLTPTQIMSEKGMRNFALADGSLPPIFNGGGGYATVFGPDSAVLSTPLPPDQEGYVTATIDLAAIDLAKNAADPAGHYSRPDVTQLVFHNQPQRVVIGDGAFGTEVSIPDLDAPVAVE